MSEKLNAAVEVLLEQLEKQTQEVADTKKTINALLARMGKEPMFEDVMPERVGGNIRPDEYYGKPLATAAQQYLERRKQACSAEEILTGLEEGGFDFRAQGWKDNDRLRSLAISLAKNTKTFHRLPNKTFGLFDWYETVRRNGRSKQEETAEEEGGQSDES